MTAEIISVGTELLLGQIVDTNAAFLAQTLADLGVGVYMKVVVGDNPQRLSDALRAALARADIVILGGGLGPTKDDLTKETVADTLGVALVNNAEAEDRLRRFFRERGISVPETNLKQALAFDGGTVFQNANGTAPGVAIVKDGKAVACLPGPPHELKPMVTNQLVPWLQGILGPDHPILVSRVIRLAGIGESLAAEKVADLLDSPNPTVAPYAKTGEVHLRVTARARNRAEAEALIDPMDAEIAARLGPFILGRDAENLEDGVVARLRALGLTLAGAESCTGGLIGDRITNVPGASDVFQGVAVTYGNRAKVDILGVRPETIERVGAVSEETAREMASGARNAYHADVAYAVTGIAGPSGGSEEKPVGTVFVAVQTPSRTAAREHRFRGAREVIKRYSAQAALNLLREMLAEPLPEEAPQ
ncbi:MAG TPA: competence/damage-inducible protein A [Armatimonadota bacterium]